MAQTVLPVESGVHYLQLRTGINQRLYCGFHLQLDEATTETRVFAPPEAEVWVWFTPTIKYIWITEAN